MEASHDEETKCRNDRCSDTNPGGDPFVFVSAPKRVAAGDGEEYPEEGCAQHGGRQDHIAAVRSKPSARRRREGRFGRSCNCKASRRPMTSFESPESSPWRRRTLDGIGPWFREP